MCIGYFQAPDDPLILEGVECLNNLVKLNIRKVDSLEGMRLFDLETFAKGQKMRTTISLILFLNLPGGNFPGYV